MHSLLAVRRTVVNEEFAKVAVPGSVGMAHANQALDQIIVSRSGWTMAASFVSRDMDQWAYQSGVTLDFSRPCKPTDIVFIEVQQQSAQRMREQALVPVAGIRLGQAGPLAYTLRRKAIAERDRENPPNHAGKPDRGHQPSGPGLGLG